MMSIVGLGLIVLAWAYQAYFASLGKLTIQRNFVLVYVTGTILLAVDGLMRGGGVSTLLNCAVALLGSLVLIRLSQPARSEKTSKPGKKRK